MQATRKQTNFYMQDFDKRQTPTEAPASLPQAPELVQSISKITEQIFIGNRNAAVDPVLIGTHGIQSILSLGGDISGVSAATLGVTELRSYKLVDGPGNELSQIAMAVGALEFLTEHSSPVLVHCHAGRSRSPLVVAAYLMKTQGLTARQAIDFIASKREINITAELLPFLNSFLK